MKKEFLSTDKVTLNEAITEVQQMFNVWYQENGDKVYIETKNQESGQILDEDKQPTGKCFSSITISYTELKNEI